MFCLYSFTKIYLAVIILAKYFGKLISDSNELKKIIIEKGKHYIVSYTRFAEITIYPWLDCVVYIML